MFHPPPADLNEREPLIHHASPGELWYRGYRIDNPPIFFGRSKKYRWDSPDGDFENAAEQKFRLRMEGVTFRGARVDMKKHEFHFAKGKSLRRGRSKS